MPLSVNHIHFFISYAVAFLVFGLIGKWYLWPAIKDRAPGLALTPLLPYACLRVNGLISRSGAVWLRNLKFFNVHW